MFWCLWAHDVVGGGVYYVWKEGCECVKVTMYVASEGVRAIVEGGGGL